jgi:UPF0755 protein
MIALMLIIALQGLAFGQGLLDSVLGPGGLGIWGGGSDQQFSPQSTYGSPPGQQQQYYPPQGQQGYSQPQSYGTQQGVYSDWYNQPPAAAGSPGVQYGGVPQQYSQQEPQIQQYPPQQYQQYPQQQQYQQQFPQQGYAPQQQYAAPQQTAPQPPQQQLRPGQYSPNQPAPGQGQMTADDLPSGAVRIMTTTPDGTTVQYYPPAGEPDAAAVPPQRQRRPAAKPARQRQTETSAPQTQQGTAPIAMPKPMELPKQDPRYGWGAQSAPTVR